MSRCKSKCCHCCAARFLGGKELNKDEGLGVVESAARARVKDVGFSGGEVPLRQDALDVVEWGSGPGDEHQ